jgi:hypothetical protein
VRENTCERIYFLFYRKGNEKHELGTVFLCIRECQQLRFTNQELRVEFVSDRMSYIILRGCWCHIIVLNVSCSNRR